METQTRSANHLAYINALVLRPGLTYKLTGKQTATIGYAYAAAWARTDTVHTFGLEHRIWEQYQIESFWRHAAIANRLRLEQGFFNQPAGRYFLLGVRYQIKTQLPLRRHPIFTRGLYMRLQDELFLHLANIQKISGSNFDQNRAYTALGYRASRHLEVEAGYLLRNQKLRRYAVENQVGKLPATHLFKKVFG